MRNPGNLRGRARVAASGLALILVMVFAMPVHAAGQPRDVMLVLDNSGSMRANDPSRLSVSAVTDFVRSQPADTRIGVVVFADAPALAQPLTASGEAGVLASLDRLDFSGQWTDTATAIERALYELRVNGREDAGKAVILMTDGIIDTGNDQRDLEKARWLREMLTEQAHLEGVRIFGLAFTERADYQLLQGIAQATGGEYFRALQPRDIAPVLRRIDRVIDRSLAGDRAAPVGDAFDASEPAGTRSEPAREPERLVFEPPAETIETEPEAPANRELPRQTGELDGDAEGPWRWLLVVIALVVLGAVAVGILWGEDVTRILQATARRRREPVDHGPSAVLYDVYDPSDIKRHELGAKPVVIGRVSGSDPAMDYVVVDERTVGRWHATIERRGQSFWIRDEGSVNGTFVNDQRVTAEHPLKHGDMVRVHRHEFEFVIPELFDSDRTMISPEAKVRKPDATPQGA